MRLKRVGQHVPTLVLRLTGHFPAFIETYRTLFAAMAPRGTPPVPR